MSELAADVWHATCCYESVSSMVLVDDRVISTKLAFRIMHLVTDEFQSFVICLYKESSYERDRKSVV